MSGFDIDRAMDERFSRYCTPRSQQYKDGWRAALMVHRGASANPYAVGTPESDAWWAGYDEGLQARPCVCATSPGSAVSELVSAEQAVGRA